MRYFFPGIPRNSTPFFLVNRRDRSAILCSEEPGVADSTGATPLMGGSVMQEARRYVRTVIFDGECGFCLRAIRIGKQLDWWRRMEWRARLEPGVNERFPQLSPEETQRRMVSIRTDGRGWDR